MNVEIMDQILERVDYIKMYKGAASGDYFMEVTTLKAYVFWDHDESLDKCMGRVLGRLFDLETAEEKLK